MLKPYRRLFPYFARYRQRYAIGAACVVVSIALKMLVPQLLGSSMDALRASDQDSIAALILNASLLIIGAATVAAVIRTISRLMILGNSRRSVHDLRADLFDQLARLSPSFYVRHSTGHLMSRCVNDMQNVQGLMGPVFMYLVETSVLYAVGLAFMLSKSPWLTLWVLLPFPFFVYAARRMATRVQQESRRGQERLAEIGSKVDESLSGQKVIKSLALEDYDLEQFAKRCRDYRQTMLDVARIRATLQPSMMFLALLSTSLLLILGVPMVIRGELMLGDMIAMIFWLAALAAPTATLGFVVSSLKRGAAALARVGEVFDMPITIKEPTDPVPDAIKNGGIEVQNLSVDFEPLDQQPHLSGSLPSQAADFSGHRQVLKDVSFTVSPGQTLGVVGTTGSGKTTLLRALARQIKVSDGQIFLDGTDVNRISVTDHRRAVGMVPQESFLFSMSLAENIALGQPTASSAAIANAADASQLSKDLHQLQDGLDTMIGERGVNLSGGQRQRTALARVLLLDPKILLLDDTLSAVDTTTSDRILTALKPMMARSTTIIVAHRISTLQHADNILVFDEGRITEQGNHQELLRRNGLYASLLRQQTRQSKRAEKLGFDEPEGQET